MNDILEKQRYATTRSSTAKNYFNIWRKFNNFITKLDKVPDTWEQRLYLYLAFLIQSGSQSSTIKSYVSAIRKILWEDHYKLCTDALTLSALTKACKLKNDSLHIRRPIRTKLLEQILFETQRKFKNQVYLEYLYKTMFILMYCGLMRIGEVAMSEHVVKATDIALGTNKRKILIVLYTSKTHDRSNLPQKIKITETPENSREKPFFCPFRLINKYNKLRGPIENDNKPFFIFRDKSPVKPEHVRAVLKDLIKDIGLDENLFDCHSLHAGRASQLLKLGFTIEQIQKAGHWKSNAVYKYLKD